MIKTLKIRLKDKHASVMSAMSREVNFVWNFCNETSSRAIRDQPPPDGEILFREGFDDADAPALLNRVVRSHLISFEPKHEHKIAGLGYLLSQACKVRLT